MKDYQNDFRHLRCFLFLGTVDWFFSACLVLLTAEEDACNEEGGGSGWRDGKSIFTLSEKCNPEGEERRISITLRNNQ